MPWLHADRFIYRFGDPCLRYVSEERQNSSTGWYDVYGSCASPGEVHTQYDYVWQDSGGAYHGAICVQLGEVLEQQPEQRLLKGTRT
jgi:hypothetical protein